MKINNSHNNSDSSRLNNNDIKPNTSGNNKIKLNTLALKYPELAKEWHPVKNDRTPDQVTFGSHK